MSRVRLMALLPLVAVLLLAGAAPAHALTTPADVAQALRSDPVFVESDAEGAREVDADKVRTQVQEQSRRIYVVVLPQRAADKLGSAKAVAIAVAGKVTGPAVVVALVGKELTAASTRGTGLDAGQAASLVSTSGGTTDRLVETVRALQQVDVGGPDSGGQGAAGAEGDTGGGGNGGTILGVLALAALGGGGLLLRRNRQRRMRELEGQRADVESLYNRLGSDVSSLPGGDDALVRQALSDAAERYNATGALLANADTPGEFAAARRTAVEGLIAARTAREKMGLDPGPEIPAPPGSGPQLTERQRVQVGDQEFEGSPDYEPGRGHYYGGGYHNGRAVPGGWYAFPFWETMLMTSVLTGGFGGGGFGGGGYERGYEEGVEDAGEARREDGGNADAGWADGGWGGGGDGDVGGWGGGGGGDTGGGGGGGDGGW